MSRAKEARSTTNRNERRQRALADREAIFEHLGEEGPYRLPDIKRVLREHRGAQRVRGERLQHLFDAIQEVTPSTPTPDIPEARPPRANEPRGLLAAEELINPTIKSDRTLGEGKLPAPLNSAHETRLAVEKIQRDLAHVLTRIRPTVRVIVVTGQPTRDQLKEYISLASPSTAGETAATFGLDLPTYFQILHA